MIDVSILGVNLARVRRNLRSHCLGDRRALQVIGSVRSIKWTAFPAEVDHRVVPAIVGRDLESAFIGRFLERAAAQSQAVVIEGPAGIGKSTIWTAAAASARDRGFLVLSSRPAETERLLPNVVLGDLFERVGPEQLATLPAPRRQAFDAALMLGDSPGPSIDPRALGVAIATLLPRLAELVAPNPYCGF